MRQLALLTAALPLAVSFCWRAYAAPAVQPLITVTKVMPAPVVDGKLSTDEWAQAARIPYLITARGEEPSQPTVAYVCYTDRALYLAFDCHEARMSRVQSAAERRDGPVWRDDSVEIFIQPATGLPYYHFITNLLGTKYDAMLRQPRQPDVSWNPKWESVVSRGADGWVAEIEIPFVSLDVEAIRPGDVWRVNCCREEKPHSEDSSWSPVKSGFHDPDRFGTFIFGGSMTPLVHLSEFTVRPNGIVRRTGQIRNFENKSLEVVLDTHIPVKSGERSFVRPVVVDAKGAQKFELVDEITDEGPLEAVLEVSLRGETLYRAVRPCYIPPVRARLAEVVGELQGLASSIGDLSWDAMGAFADTLRELRVRREELSRAVLYLPDSAPEEAGRIMRAVDDLERRISAARLKVKMRAADMGSAPFFVWSADPWVQLKPGDLPTSDSAPPGAQVFAYRGENVYAAVNVTNLGDRTLEVRISSGPFCTKAGDVVPASQVEVHTCAFVKEEAKSNVLVGDALPVGDQAGRIIIPPAQTGQAFFVIRTAGLPAGEYCGPITAVPTTGGVPQTADLCFSIYSLDLPDEPKPRLCTWGDILGISWAKPDPALYLQDAAEHGINVFFLSPYLVTPKLDKDGNITEPIDYAKHDEFAAAYKKHGMLVGAYSIGVIYDRWARQAGMEYMSPAYQKGFISWLRDWVGHLKGLGLTYEDFAFQIADEPGSEERFELHMDIGRLARKADPKARIVLTANFFEVARLKEISEVVDIWVPHGGVLETDIARRVMEESGKEMWVYVCSGDSKRLDPTSYYRSLPWQAFRYDLSGWGFFAHMWWGELPWESSNTTGKHLGTYSTVYPGTNGPVTSRRWEAYYKGHEDFCALHLLKRLVTRGEKAGLDRGLLAKARSVLEESANAAVELGALKEEQAGSVESARHLDRIRREVADVSIKLGDALEAAE